MLTPVVLPPGWASELTNPLSTRSSAPARIGIVRVAFCAARVSWLPTVEIASTPAVATATSASSRTEKRPSTCKFCPSTNPNRRSSSNNAT
jgi:hypothetical protein